MQTLEEVLNKLWAIIESAIRDNDPIGIFSFIYWRTTKEIKKHIEAGNFEDNARMEQFDVAFAKLFLSAYEKYNIDKLDSSVSKSWAIAFNSSRDNTIIQNVLLGMNAHINLDLSIAAAQIMTNKDISALKGDYDKVNDILKSLIEELESRISNASKLFFLLDWIGAKSDEVIMDFSMKKARQLAWLSAVQLVALDKQGKKLKIQNMDNVVHKIALRIDQPRSRVLRSVLFMIRKFEPKRIKAIIKLLNVSGDGVRV